jgi:hypothetical protein
MARGLHIIASGVSGQSLAWCPVTPRGEDAPGALIALTRPICVDPQQARRDYLERYRQEDPFAPHRVLDTRRPLLTMSDIGGPQGLASTLYGSEFLPEFRVAYETALYIRDGDTMLGSIRVARTAEDGPFTVRDNDFLMRAQLLLESSYCRALIRSDRP